MKKIILVLVVAVIGMAGFAQKITVYNELYSELLAKEAIKDATSKFWGIRDRLYGKIESEKWDVEAGFGVKFGDAEKLSLLSGYAVGEDYVLADNGIRANVWLKPWNFLTISAGNTLEYVLSPVNMVARDKRMDNDDGMWANTSFAVAVTPMENLLVGVAIPLPTDLNDQFKLQLGAQYKLFEDINIGAKYYGVFGKPETARQNDLGLYADYIGFENLRIAAGFTGHLYDNSDCNRSLIDIAADYKWNSFVFAADATIAIGSFDKITCSSNNFVPFTTALYAGLDLSDNNQFTVYARAILAWNQACFGNDITRAAFSDGAMSVLIQPGVKFTLSKHHSFGAEIDMGFCKPHKNGDTGFGISFPVYWKYTF